LTKPNQCSTADFLTEFDEHPSAVQKVYSKDQEALEDLQNSVEFSDEFIRSSF
jgi:hypothetical protein